MVFQALHPSTVRFSYWVLDHLHALPPHLGDNGWYIHHILSSSLLQSCVNGNQCACPPHTSTACRERRKRQWTCHFDDKVLQTTHYFQCTYYTISNPSWPAVHQCRSLGELHMGLYSTEVVEDWTSVLWNTMVWPGGKVELCHLQWTSSNLVTLHGDEETRWVYGRNCDEVSLLKTFINYTAYVKQTNTSCIASFSGSPHAQRIKRSNKQY